MSKRTIGSALAATGLIAATALAVLTAGPASATGNGNGHGYGKCEEVKHYDLKDVTHEGGGSAELTRWGLRMKTPDIPSRVRWETPVKGKNLFAYVKELSYKTYSHEDGIRGFAAPALRIGLSKHGKPPVTLVYEPYFNGTVQVGGPWQPWDAIDGGNAKWWWAQEPGNLQTNHTWSYWQDEYKHYKVEFVNVGMGTYNEGADATVNDLEFKIGYVCETHSWKKPKHEPTPKPSVTTTAPKPKPSESTSTATVPAVPGGGGSGSLPVTGAGVAGLTVVGGLLLAAGVVFVVFTRRRRFEV